MEHPAERLFLLAATLISMAGLGATQSWAQLASTLRRPAPLLIGMGSQFGLMPAIAFGLAIGLKLDDRFALGLIIVASAPGGLISNLLTYFARGNVGLSVSMTLASTSVTVVTIPAVLWIYGSRFAQGAALRLPWGQIIVGLAMMAIPLGLGMLAKAKRPAIASALERAMQLTGIAVIAYLSVAWFYSHGHLLFDLPLANVVAPGLLVVLGFGGGYAVSALLGLGVPERRAISIETGIQNAVLAMAIIGLTFPAESQQVLMWPALLYGMLTLVPSIALTLYFRAPRPSQRRASLVS